MPFLNFDVDYFDHIKTIRLVGLLGKGAAELPIRLWCRAAKHHCEDGILTAYSAQEIEALVGWWGKQGEMVEAMCKVGFLKKLTHGYQLNSWKEINGHLVAFKKRAKVAAKERWRLHRQKTRAMLQVMPKHKSSNAPSVPNQAVPNQAVPNQALPSLTEPTESQNHDAPRSLKNKLITALQDHPDKPFVNRVLRELGNGVVAECAGEVQYRSKTQTISNPEGYFFTILKERLAEKEKHSAGVR